MSTEKQLEANRSNALKSTGPRTESGKQRSALNALRHGLTGQVAILPHEDREAYEKFTTGILTGLSPDGDHELELARAYARSLWNLHKAQTIQDNLFTLGLMEEVGRNLDIEQPEIHNAVAYAETFRRDSETFSRISLYTQRLVSQSKSLHKQFEEVHARSLARRESDLFDALRAFKYKKMMGETFEPDQNGFVSSIDQIRFYEHRRNLNNHADIAESCRYDRTKYEETVKKLAA